MSGFCAPPVYAQDALQSSASVYSISNVDVDVTADSAAKARDQAIAQAQRAAFAQLLERLGAEASAGAKLSDNDLATLVQNFEVRDEHSSSVRYIGTFAVQFRPLAVRNFLGRRNAVFNDTPGRPVMVLPLTRTAGKTTLWEEPTPWRKAWSDAAQDGGIAPVIVPAGSGEDKAALSTADAAAGKGAAVKALMDAYHADAAVVAILNGSPDNPAAGFVVDLQHFGANDEDGSDVEHITLIGSADKNAVDGMLKDGIRQIRRAIDKEARKQAKTEVAPAAAPAPAPAQNWADEEPPAQLPVMVQTGSLAQWADIQRRLQATPGVRRVAITAIGRGTTQIELGFAGTPQDIQAALAQHNLRLGQDILSGQWVLKGF